MAFAYLLYNSIWYICFVNIMSRQKLLLNNFKIMFKLDCPLLKNEMEKLTSKCSDNYDILMLLPEKVAYFYKYNIYKGKNLWQFGYFLNESFENEMNIENYILNNLNEKAKFFYHLNKELHKEFIFFNEWTYIFEESCVPEKYYNDEIEDFIDNKDIK